jgi:hypothetical protein
LYCISDILQYLSVFYKLLSTFPIFPHILGVQWFCSTSEKAIFSKKVVLRKLLFLARFATNFRCSWYQWIQNCQAHHFLIGLHINSIFWENGREITKGKKIDFVFWRFFKIVIWRPMFKFCSLQDNRKTYPKSIGYLVLCHIDPEISTREVTPWPCNNFAGQCTLSKFWVLITFISLHFGLHLILCNKICQKLLVNYLLTSCQKFNHMI